MVDGAIGMLRPKTYGDLTSFRAINHTAQYLRTNALTLKLWRDDKFADMNVAAAVFNAHVTAGNAVTQYDFKRGGIPILLEELVLSFFVPHAELPHDHITVSLMVHGASKVSISIECLTLGYFHNARYALSVPFVKRANAGIDPLPA